MRRLLITTMLALAAGCPAPATDAQSPASASSTIEGWTAAPSRARRTCKSGDEGAWNYTADVDKMRATSAPIATLESSNVADLGPPYGESHLAIGLYGADDGDRVALVIGHGQFSCNGGSYDSCEISYRLDDEDVRTETVFRAGDRNSTLVLGLRNSQSVREWMGRLCRAKRIVIEVPLFEHGRVQFEFNVGGLRWPPPEAKAAGSGSALAKPDEE